MYSTFGIPTTAAATGSDNEYRSIIERLQRRLERQGMNPQQADRAVAIALRSIATR
jgi:hypothetical protein